MSWGTAPSCGQHKSNSFKNIFIIFFLIKEGVIVLLSCAGAEVSTNGCGIHPRVVEYQWRCWGLSGNPLEFQSPSVSGPTSVHVLNSGSPRPGQLKGWGQSSHSADLDSYRDSLQESKLPATWETKSQRFPVAFDKELRDFGGQVRRFGDSGQFKIRSNLRGAAVQWSYYLYVHIVHCTYYIYNG